MTIVKIFFLFVFKELWFNNFFQIILHSFIYNLYFCSKEVLIASLILPICFLFLYPGFLFSLNACFRCIMCCNGEITSLQHGFLSNKISNINDFKTIFTLKKLI